MKLTLSFPQMIPYGLKGLIFKQRYAKIIIILAVQENM